MGKYIGIISAVILGACIIGYTYLGGFSSPEVSVAEMQTTTVYGKAYDGDIQLKAFGNIFDEMSKIAEKEGGVLCAVYYNDPDKTNGKAKAFVGIKSDKEIAGLEKRTFEKQKVVKAVLKANYLVAPVKVYPSIKDFAAENNISITDIALETYPSEKQMTVEVFVKE